MPILAVGLRLWQGQGIWSMEELRWLVAAIMNTCVAKTGEICRSLHSCGGDFFSGKTAGVICRAGGGTMVSATASWVWQLLLFLLFLLSEGLSFTGLSVVRPKWNLHVEPPKTGITGPYPALPFLVGKHFLTDQCPPGTGMILRWWACLPDLRVHDFPSTVKFLKNPGLVLFVGSCLFIDLPSWWWNQILKPILTCFPGKYLLWWKTSQMLLMDMSPTWFMKWFVFSPLI